MQTLGPLMVLTEAYLGWWSSSRNPEDKSIFEYSCQDLHPSRCNTVTHILKANKNSLQRLKKKGGGKRINKWMLVVNAFTWCQYHTEGRNRHKQPHCGSLIKWASTENWKPFRPLVSNETSPLLCTLYRF